MKNYKITENELTNLLYVLNSVIGKAYEAEFISEKRVLVITGYDNSRSINFEEI